MAKGTMAKGTLIAPVGRVPRLVDAEHLPERERADGCTHLNSLLRAKSP